MEPEESICVTFPDFRGTVVLTVRELVNILMPYIKKALEEDKDGVLEAIPSAIPPSDPVLCGYDFKQLVAFALACRRAEVNEGDLKTFANNLDFAFQIASEELRRQQMEAVAKSMGGKQE